MTRLGKRWLKNTYQTISSILQFTLLPGAFINNHCQSSKGHGTSSDFDIYASMSFSTSTLVLHESGSIVFGSRNRDHKSRDYPHTCSGRYGLELFLEAKLNGNKLTVIPGFWRNTELRKKYYAQNNRTWSWNGDINGWHSEGAYWTIFPLLSLGILETYTETYTG